MNTVIKHRNSLGHMSYVLTVRAPAEEYVGCVACRGTGRESYLSIEGRIIGLICPVCSGLGAYKVASVTPPSEG